MQKIAVIIVTWNGEKVIRQCLDSVFNNSTRLDLEVIVVDNGSCDRTVEIIEKYFPSVKIIKNSRNLGFACANNQGIEKAVGRQILLLNQDIILPVGTLEKLHRYLEENFTRGVAAVAPQLINLDGSIQESCRLFPTPGNVLRDLFSFGRWHKKQYVLQKSQFVDQPMASCLLLSGEILKKIKGFDCHKDFFLFFNDVDLSRRIANLGYKHYYLKEAQAIHHHGQSTEKWSRSRKIEAWCRGLYYYLSKHYALGGNFIKKLAIGVEVFFIYTVRMLGEVGLGFRRRKGTK